MINFTENEKKANKVIELILESYLDTLKRLDERNISEAGKRIIINRAFENWLPELEKAKKINKQIEEQC